MESRVRQIALILLTPTVLFLWQCQKKEEPTAPQPATNTPVASQLALSSTTSPPATTSAEGQGIGDCCEIVTNPELKGRLGRLVVAFPDGAKVSRTRVNVLDPATQQQLTGGYGNHTFELLPRTYTVVISGKPVENVTIKAGHDTTVKVGVLSVHAGKDTRVDLLDRASQQKLTGGYGEQQFGLPVGQVSVQVAGQSEAVTIEAGKITDF